MENQTKHDLVTTTDSPSHKRHSGEHITLSPPAGSPANSPDRSSLSSESSPNKIIVSKSHHSPHNSGEHISLSPPAGSPENSPDRSSVSSDSLPNKIIVSESFPHHHSNKNSGEHISISPPANSPGNSSPENDKLHSVENKPPPAVTKTATITPSLSILRRAKTENLVKKTALGFRILGFLFCLVSFSVMAADRNQGWAIDSFERYIEFRYCMSVNVIGFVYSGVQAIDLSYRLVTGKYILQNRSKLRYYVNFAIDQMIAYLLISSSSSATTRVEDWKSNWGNDKFPFLASASVSMSFLAFVAIASSALVSGYDLCTAKYV